MVHKEALIKGLMNRGVRNSLAKYHKSLNRCRNAIKVFAPVDTVEKEKNRSFLHILNQAINDFSQIKDWKFPAYFHNVLLCCIQLK